MIKLKEGLITLEQFKNDTKNKMNEIYWQVVSNAIINSKPIAEIIAFTPTESQLLQIREELEETNVLEKLGIDPWKARFIVEKNLSELSYLPDGIDVDYVRWLYTAITRAQEKLYLIGFKDEYFKN